MTTRILIIEDNAANLELMRYLLTAFGYEVVSAGDGERGLELVRSEPFALVLCDIQLPRLDGYQVASAFKSDPRLKGIPLLAVSALAMVGDRDRILAAGFDGYLSKPLEPRAFVDRVEAHLLAEMRVPRPARAAYEVGDAARPLPRRDVTILLVDDVPENLDVLRSTLEPIGYRVRVASNGDEALSSLDEEPVDLILSDLHLEGEPDFEFIRRLKASPRHRAIPVVFVSSTAASPNLAEVARAEGAARFLFRPIDPTALIMEVEQCLIR